MHRSKYKLRWGSFVPVTSLEIALDRGSKRFCFCMIVVSVGAPVWVLLCI